jgi:acetylornithine deacetylase
VSFRVFRGWNVFIQVHHPAPYSLADRHDTGKTFRTMNDDVASLLQALIRIPSVNPDNSPGTRETGETAIAEFLRDWLEEIGGTVTIEEIQPGRPNLIARFAPLDGRPRILFGPHLDTVGVANMTIDPFGGEIRDGKIWGRGASDTKGPMAAMLIALQRNRDQLASLPIAIDFVAFMGEESGQWGSKHFAKHHGADYSFALVGEPTSMEIVHLTKGSLWATLRATGRAAHSSQPERGDNAIVKLASAMLEINRKLGTSLARFTHPQLGHSTLNIGLIRGGSRPNIVPDLAEAELDIRITPSLASFTHPQLGHSTLNIGLIRGGSRPNIVPDLAEAELDIRITPSLAAAGGGLQLLRDCIARHQLPIELINPHENPPMETSPDHPMIQRLLNTHPGTKLACAPWFSDAAHLSHSGIPSICIGPGSIDQAHTVDEYIKIDALNEGADFFTSFVAGLMR